MSLLKRIAAAMLPPGVLVFLVLSKHKLTHKGTYSFLDEERVMQTYLDGLRLNNRYCVDIAASDGISSSNTYSLFKSGWGGIAVELDSTRFAMLAVAYRSLPNVHLIKTKVLPDNVVSILNACLCPKDLSLLNLDIDGYDFFVLDELLKEFRPRLICAEINETIPPPIRFTVKYDTHHSWTGGHFHGQSVSQCCRLCEKYDYDIVGLHYNNLFIVPRELNTFPPLSAEEAYEIGYKNKADRKTKFPWDSDMEDLLSMGREEGIDFLQKKFEEYSGKFILE